MWQVRQNFVAQLIHLWSISCTAVRHRLGEESGRFIDQCCCGIVVFSASHLLAEHTSQMLWFHRDSESYSWSDRQQTTKQWPWPSFGASLALGSALESNHWAVIASCHERPGMLWFMGLQKLDTTERLNWNEWVFFWWAGLCSLNL